MSKAKRATEVRECRVCGDQFKVYAKAKRSDVCPRCRAEAHFGVGWQAWSIGEKGEGDAR